VEQVGGNRYVKGVVINKGDPVMTTPKQTTLLFAADSQSRGGAFDDRLLTEKEVAARQGRSVKTLQNQRLTGEGIPYLKLGRSVRYRLSDVLAWEEAGLCLSTSSEGGRHG
jgi:predicted DNA-binding transcriptional regulator AlpA